MDAVLLVWFLDSPTSKCKVLYKFKSDLVHVLVLLDFRDPNNLHVDMDNFSSTLLSSWCFEVGVAGLAIQDNSHHWELAIAAAGRTQEDMARLGWQAP
jgi:hypothetical protein